MSGCFRHRFRIAFAAVFCLAFQQIALAAYSCPATQAPAAQSMSEHCAALAAQAGHDNPALCATHCAPGSPAPPDVAKVAVPVLSAPPHFMLLLPAQGPAPGAAVAQGSAPHVEPPPRLRFCSLLI